MASGMLSMMKVNALFDKNATGMTVSFEDGKILMKSKQFFNENVMKVMEKYPMKDISADMVNRIPSQNVVAAVVMNYPPEGLKELLKLVGFDGAANAYLQQVGFSVDEFVKANKGDVVMAVTDLEVQRSEDSSRRSENENTSGRTDLIPGFKYMFATSVNDRAAFDKMVGIVAAQLGDIPQMAGMPQLKYSMNNNWFAAGNSQEQVDQFLSGANNKHAFTSRISGQPFGAFIDIQKIMSRFSTDDTDTTKGKFLDPSMKMWQDILVTGGKIKNDAMNYEVEINLVNKSVNSLKQLNQYFDQLSLARTRKAAF
jgi:hypothetical protein